MVSKKFLENKVITNSIVFVLFCVVLTLRLIIAFQSDAPDFEGYDTLRKGQFTAETGKPLYDDELSYGGRERIFPPLWSYIIAFFGSFLPMTWVIKIIPNILTASIVFPAFWLVQWMTKKTGIALICAGLTGLAPALFFISINDGTSVGFALSLIVLSMYLFLRSRKQGVYLHALLITLVVLTLLSYMSLVLLGCLFVYFLLLSVQRIKTTKKEGEIFLFYAFFSLWFLMVSLKKALVTHGANVFWQNVPVAELNSLFSRLTVVEAISSTGIIILISGVIAIYYGLASTQKKSVVLATSILMGAAALMWFKLIALTTGLALLAISLTITSSIAFAMLYDFFSQTKASKAKWWIISVIVGVSLLLLLPTLFSSKIIDVPLDGHIKVTEWAKDNLADDAVIVTVPKEGFLVEYVAEKKVVMDTDYLLVENIEERYSDVQRIFQTNFMTERVSLMQKYDATHILVSPISQFFAGVENISLEEDCFRHLRSFEEEGEVVALFELTCSVQGDVS